jgi:hypothetical protein
MKKFIQILIVILVLFVLLFFSKLVAGYIVNILLFVANLFLGLNEYSPGGNLPWDRHIVDLLIRLLGDCIFITLPIFVNRHIFINFLKWDFNFKIMPIFLVILIVIFIFVRVFFHKEIFSGLSLLFYLIPLIPVIVFFDKNGDFFKKNDEKE